MKRGSKLRRALLSLGVVLISGGLLFLTFLLFRSQIDNYRDEQAYQSARSLLATERPEKAIEIIRNRKRKLTGERETAWIDLEIDALERSGNTGRLRYLFDLKPAAFSRHEPASLLIARSMLLTNNLDAYLKVRNTWKTRSIIPAAWFALDVDALIMERKVNEALKLLNASSFKGEADAGRLMRLALLTAGKDRRGAWNYLDQAYTLAPKNPEVRSFRAQLLESTGQLSRARVEYVAAHLAQPRNPLFRDQLAEYYRRNGNIGLALQTWSGDLDERSPDFIRLKALFWSQITYPVKISKTTEADLSGDLSSFVLYLQKLPSGRFWDDGAFEKVTEKQAVLEKRQEAFWLRIVQALKDGDEKKAYNLLQDHTFKSNSWSPDIQSALERVLAYRLGQKPPLPDDDYLATGTKTGERHQFFLQLDQMAKTGVVTPELATLLRSKEAFASVFMAGGWIETALQLHTLPVVPDNFPNWVAYGMTQSIRFNRGNKAALDFAGRQKQSAAMALLSAELLIAEGQTAEGLKRLESLSGTDSDIGFRAAWLLTLARMDQRNLKGARSVLLRQPRLRNSITGKEIEARISLSEGDTQNARKIYQALGKESTEAMAYLAKKAYQERDWKTARTLTETLILKLPDRMELRSNLKAIAKAEGRL